MRTVKVLVTGVGAIIGYGIVRALKSCRYPVNVVGMDVYPDAVGQLWCDGFRQSVWATDPTYTDFLGRVIEEENVDLVMFGVEEEICRICGDRVLLGHQMDKLVLNRPELVELSQDKWLLHRHLVENEFKSIPTMIIDDFDQVSDELGLPCLVKPRRSSASKGITAIDSRDEFVFWRDKLGDQFMVQQIVGDKEHEYTVGVFGLGDGSFAQSFTLARTLGRDGSTARAKTVDLPGLEKQVAALTNLLAPLGPTNLQFRRHGDDYLLLEVNPRFSSSLSIRAAFGFNEPEMCIEYFLDHEPPVKRSTARGTAVRYIEDSVRFE